ncbi:acyl-CoA N-acyltransferase [Coniochaeta ligniaria NRRL 30616]|uniref:Acyl-CoA N-acyltransferase n=1 Tax=Coniochaeta ligniaria NRRL 30616 TaxID=1408157 RepID=A0A1J7JWQ7_9PEZI|nr:acyl-CoA N-acyltransferase [Coniochaeta ligniaria NRRL 30616]
MEYAIDIIRPDEEGIEFYLESYKPFRLLALQLSPEAFTSTHAQWSALGDDAWISRLTNPRAKTFVATRQYGPVKRVLSSLTLFASDSNEQAASSGPMAWHVNAVFTLPEARRKGVASSVMAAAKHFAREQAEAQKRDFFLVTTVLAANPGAKLLYEKLGFRIASVTEAETEMIFGQSRSRCTRITRM